MLRVSPFGTDKTPMMAHASSQGEEIMNFQETEQRRHDHRAGDTFGKEHNLRQSDHPTARWLDRQKGIMIQRRIKNGDRDLELRLRFPSISSGIGF